jgi:hypothetical protein
VTTIARSGPAPVRLAEARRILAVPRSWTAVAMSFAVATVAFTGTIGPDARWLDALGRVIVERGHVPRGIPFAGSPSADWQNVPVLAELVFHGLVGGFGERGLLVAQLVAVAAGLWITSRSMRRAGATDAGAALVLVLLVPGGLLALAGIKAQLFSLALFPLVVGLVRNEARRPSRRIWVLPLLVGLWSNLHGAVLVGLGVALAYLVLERMRRRPVESVVLAVASLLAVCATPALARTPQYYSTVLNSEASRAGYGLWAPLSLRSGFDLLLGATALALLLGFLLTRPPLWELAVAAVLAVETVHAARNGVWLLLFVAVRAAAAVPIRSRPHPALVQGLAATLVLGASLALIRGPLVAGARDRLVDDAIEVAAGSGILAEPTPAEQIAAAGGRVWISNPLDAFRRVDQRAYLEWLRGRPAGDRLLRNARVVVASSDSPAGRRLGRSPLFRVLETRSTMRIFLRSS